MGTNHLDMNAVELTTEYGI